MKARKGWTVLGAAVVLAVGIPAFAGAADTFKEVIVKNADTAPVPTKAVSPTTVTGTVDVGNLPGTQSVSGTVDVGNLPATQQVTGSVDISNLPATQRVRDADASHLQPFHFGSDGFGNSVLVLPDGQFGLNESATVPEGKTLVIEFASARIALPSGQVPHLVSVNVRSGSGAANRQRMVLKAENVSTTPQNLWSASQEVRMYAPAGSEVSLSMNRSPHNTGEATVSWSVTGYLVDN